MKKYFAVLLVLGVVVSSCGDDSSSASCAGSPIVGSWTLTTGITLTFRDTCTWSSTKCNQTGTYPMTSANSGTIEVVVERVNPDPGYSCLDTGTYDCTYAINNGTMVYACE